MPETPFDDGPAKPNHDLVPQRPRKKLEPDEVMRYWASVPERERNEWFIGYVYRDLPVCDPLQPLSVDDLRKIQKDKRLKPPTNIAKLTEPFDPDNWLQIVRDKWGAGEYRIRVNDQHPSVKQTVVECSIDAGRDWSSYPPVLSPATVVLSEPKNEPYLRWARLKGIKFPGDPDFEQVETEERDNEDMATVNAVEKLTDALIAQSQQANRPQPIAVPSDGKETAKIVEVLSEAAKESNKIVLEGIRTAQNAQAKATDPMGFHTAIMEAAKVLAPPPPPPAADNTALLLGMFKMMQDNNALVMAQMEKRVEAAERQAQEARAVQVAPPAPVVSPAVSNPIRDAIDLLKGFASLRDTAGSVLGGAEAAAESEPLWLRVVNKVADVAPNLVYNAAVLKNGGTPAPPDVRPELIEAEKEPAGEQVAEQQTEEKEVFTKARIAQEIATPLIESINRGEKGYQFAAGMMLTPKILGVFSGRTVYEMAIEEGEQGMMAICQAYPPLWEKLIMIPTRFQQFLSEFMDRNMANQVVANYEAANRVAPPAAPAPDPVKNGRAVIDPKTGKPQVVAHRGPVVNEAS